jgi:hypothetical protein
LLRSIFIRSSAMACISFFRSFSQEPAAGPALFARLAPSIAHRAREWNSVSYLQQIYLSLLVQRLTSSETVRPLRRSTSWLREGISPDGSSFEMRSTRHMGKNRSPKPIKGSSWTTACIQLSKAFKSRPRKNTPAGLISSRRPQHFSRGECSTIITAVPVWMPVPGLSTAFI